jgi:pimeloyl-ACP methyl ester carboxylesterase
LEKYFTVCYWDQRGAGMTYNKQTDQATMTVERIIEDTRQMTEYLRNRFNQSKICLIGHSWGTYLGVKTITKYPENYHAFIGIGQVSHQKESEKSAYEYMLQHAVEINDVNAIKKLKKFDKNAPDFPPIDYIMRIRSELMNKYGIGVAHEFSMSDFVKSILFFQGYTLSEKINYFKGSLFSLNHLWGKLIDDNLLESTATFQIPVYITHGKYDYQVSYSMAREYFDIIDAPRKAFFTFENSAHSPIFEEPEKFVQTILSIHQTVNTIDTSNHVR